MFKSLYLGVSLGIVGIAVWLILIVRRRGISGWFVGCLAGICFSILFMIKMRCKTDTYGCGFMSFTGGFTWHLFAGLAVFGGMWALCGLILSRSVSEEWQFTMNHLGRAMTPLLGLGIAVVWEVLPVSLIHPPFVDGVCPDLPIICHDIPVWGYGGLLYWTAPFFAWATISIWLDVNRLLGRTEMTHLRPSS